MKNIVNKKFLKVFRNNVLLFPFSKFDIVKFLNLFINIVREFEKEVSSKFGSSFVSISM